MRMRADGGNVRIGLGATALVILMLAAPLVHADMVIAAPRCTLIGTPGDDVLVGTTGDDVLCGLGGDDELWGGAGEDILLGGPGSDRLIGGRGDDRLDGGTGRDEFAGGTGTDTVVRDVEDGTLRILVAPVYPSLPTGAHVYFDGRRNTPACIQSMQAVTNDTVGGTGIGRVRPVAVWIPRCAEEVAWTVMVALPGGSGVQEVGLLRLTLTPRRPPSATCTSDQMACQAHVTVDRHGNAQVHVSLS